MTTQETPFVTFWRAHNVKLAALGQPAATNSEAVQAFKVWAETKNAWLPPENEAEMNERTPLEGIVRHLVAGKQIGDYVLLPNHQRNTGKTL